MIIAPHHGPDLAIMGPGRELAYHRAKHPVLMCEGSESFHGFAVGFTMTIIIYSEWRISNAAPGHYSVEPFCIHRLYCDFWHEQRIVRSVIQVDDLYDSFTAGKINIRRQQIDIRRRGLPYGNHIIGRTTAFIIVRRWVRE